MPGRGRPFEKGNKAGLGNKGGRPKLNIASLADETADEVLRTDLALIRSKPTTKEGKFRRAQALERASRMCKGRVPTRIAIAGDEGGDPVPFSYVEVGTAVDVAPKKPQPRRARNGRPVSKKKKRLKATQRLHNLSQGTKKRK